VTRALLNLAIWLPPVEGRLSGGAVKNCAKLPAAEGIDETGRTTAAPATLTSIVSKLVFIGQFSKTALLGAMAVPVLGARTPLIDNYLLIKYLWKQKGSG